MSSLSLSRRVARSKVARRVVLLFVTCSLMPIAVLAIITEWRVADQLTIGAWTRLRDQSKTTGMEILERLQHLDSELRAAMSHEHGGGEVAASEGHWGDGFRSVGRIADDLELGLEALVGPMDGRRLIPPEMRSQLASGRTLLVTAPASGMSRLFMIRRLSLEETREQYVVGEIDKEYLLALGDRNILPGGLEHCIVESRVVLGCTSAALAGLRPPELRAIADTASEQAELRAGGGVLLAASWTVPLHTWLVTPGWTVVSAQQRSDALGPLSEFRWSFVLSVLLSIWIVLLASFVQIRRSLRPLEQLREGTQRVTAGDLATPVVVSSHDEFEDLAKSFNEMTREIDRERTMTAAVGDLERAVLSALEAPSIVKAILQRLPPLLKCTSVSVTLVDDVRTGTARTHVRSDASETAVALVQLTPAEIGRLQTCQPWCVDVAGGVPAFLQPMLLSTVRAITALPVQVDGGVAAVVSLGTANRGPLSRETLSEATRLLGHISVALSNARLLEALDKLNLGTLNALARTVDAKCRWTAGHSGRVGAIAVELGKACGFGRAEVETIYRGALLHDIGKIGVPNEILDKAAALNEEEWRLMREHPRLGARILEPIGEYRAIIPMVLQHHEWIDGSGYPDGLSGEAIHREARLLAVVDVYDAMRSDRPYRGGLSLDATLSAIRDHSGRQFDPGMVRVFLELVAARRETFVTHSSWDGF